MTGKTPDDQKFSTLLIEIDLLYNKIFCSWSYGNLDALKGVPPPPGEDKLGKTQGEEQ